MKVALAAASAWSLAEASLAAAPPEADERIARLESLVAEQAKQITEQQNLLARQAQSLTELRRLTDSVLESNRGAGLQVSSAAAPGSQGASSAQPLEPIRISQARPAVPDQPVGEAPPAAEAVEIASLPEGAGVLTPRGRFVLEPSFDYSHGSSNRLVFRGVEIVTGIQIGVIEASDADRDTLSGAVSLRYGLFDRLELEARVPYIDRSDRVTTLVQMDEAVTRTFELDGRNIGDVEVAARYQFNRAGGRWPIFIGNVRIKSDTGTSPFEIDRDEFGIATRLATGSGFWGIEPSLSVLYPTDPAVLFASVSYLAHLPKDINRTVGQSEIGRVDPGDSVGFGAGFGFALNPRFSFSLGYKHNYIYPTESEIGDTMQESPSIQVGAFTMGWSFALTDRLTISNSYEVGTTRDSPDMRISLRLPYRF
jgi:uncharacterized coiled-coil protein SlyX